MKNRAASYCVHMVPMSPKCAVDVPRLSALFASPDKARAKHGARGHVGMGLITTRASAAVAECLWPASDKAQFTVIGPAECGRSEKKPGTAQISLTCPYKIKEL